MIYALILSPNSVNTFTNVWFVLQLNSTEVCVSNCYRLLLLTAFKFHCYASCLPDKQRVKDNPGFFHSKLVFCYIYVKNWSWSANLCSFWLCYCCNLKNWFVFSYDLWHWLLLLLSGVSTECAKGVYDAFKQIYMLTVGKVCQIVTHIYIKHHLYFFFLFSLETNFSLMSHQMWCNGKKDLSNNWNLHYVLWR